MAVLSLVDRQCAPSPELPAVRAVSQLGLVVFRLDKTESGYIPRSMFRPKLYNSIVITVDKLNNFFFASLTFLP